MTWDELDKKYPETRSNKSEDREKEFVNDCFNCYEQEGFAKKFWSPSFFDSYKERIGQRFKVIVRCTTEEADLASLPRWNIEFSDGTVIEAYPEDIIPSEMRRNGCLLNDI